MSSLLAEQTELEAFEAFAAELRTEDGDPFYVHDFQEMILAPYFEGVTSTVIIVPKKNGKTTLIAALALYHLLVTQNADCIIVASSREQAGICLKAARIFVRNSPELSALMSINQRTINLLGEEGRIRILASDEATLDGENPTLAIVDELHRHKDLDVYGVLRDGMVRPGARMVTISTAGARFDSPLGTIREMAHQMPGFVREAKFNRVRSEDGAFAFFEWCLDPGDDVEDFDIVKLANPAPWMTIERLRERRVEPGMTLYRWLRFACGIWTEGEEPWIDPPTWDALPEGKPEGDVWLGVDIGNIGEPSAIVICGKKEGHFVAEARILADPDLEAVEDEIRTIRKDYKVTSCAFDPRMFPRSAEMLEKEGLTMLEFPQTAERMGKASATLWRLIERQELHYPHADKTFRAHVLAGVVKEDQRGWRLAKDPRTRRPVAGLVALAMAVQTAADGGPKTYVVW